MRVIKATAGENVFYGLLRAMNTIEILGESICEYVHNGISTTVRANSNLLDLCEKHDLKRQLTN